MIESIRRGARRAGRDFADRIRLHRLDERLRRLQTGYIQADRKSEALILDYFRTLEEARGLYLEMVYRRRPITEPRPVCIHLGAGDHRLEGWINVDILDSSAADLVANLSTGIPVRSNSVDFIHSEDLLEHLELEGGRRVIEEAHRVLKPGGVMRLLTPDLRALVTRLYLDRSAIDLRWCDVYLDAATPCEALNMHLRMCGEHRFVYDEEFLRALLVGAGFRVKKVSFNRSRYPLLRYLDLRDFKLNMFLECEK